MFRLKGWGGNGKPRYTKAYTHRETYLPARAWDAHAGSPIHVIWDTAALQMLLPICHPCGRMTLIPYCLQSGLCTCTRLAVMELLCIQAWFSMTVYFSLGSHKCSAGDTAIPVRFPHCIATSLFVIRCGCHYNINDYPNALQTQCGLPAPDCMIQNNHAICLQCDSKKVACTSLAWCNAIWAHLKWAFITF